MHMFCGPHNTEALDGRASTFLDSCTISQLSQKLGLIQRGTKNINNNSKVALKPKTNNVFSLSVDTLRPLPVCSFESTEDLKVCHKYISSVKSENSCSL